MARSGYTAISVPDGLLFDVDRIVRAGLLGYRSSSEFVIAAVREKVERTFDLQASATAILERRIPPEGDDEGSSRRSRRGARR